MNTSSIHWCCNSNWYTPSWFVLFFPKCVFSWAPNLWEHLCEVGVFLSSRFAPPNMEIPLTNAALVLLLFLLICKTFFLSDPNHIKSLLGKHVVITGGSSGIGFALAKRCVSEGAFVTLMSRTESNLVKARDSLIEIVGAQSDRILLKVDFWSGALKLGLLTWHFHLYLLLCYVLADGVPDLRFILSTLWIG